MENEKEIKKLEQKLKESKYKPIESPIEKYKFLKDKEGNKLSVGEFLKKWGEGIKNLNPIQKLTNESRATLITLIGSITCLIALIIFRNKLIVSWFAYGLILIFIGNTWNTGLKLIGLRQQLRYFKNTDNQSIDLNDMLDKLDSMKGGQNGI